MVVTIVSAEDRAARVAPQARSTHRSRRAPARGTAFAARTAPKVIRISGTAKASAPTLMPTAGSSSGSSTKSPKTPVTSGLFEGGGITPSRSGSKCSSSASVATRSGAPRALLILPPGEGNTITAPAFAHYQASGDCADLGPNFCDQLGAYEHWRFRDARLAPQPPQVAGAVRSETPEAGVTIVRDQAGVPHVYASGPDEQINEERLAPGMRVPQAQERLDQVGEP